MTQTLLPAVPGGPKEAPAPPRRPAPPRPGPYLRTLSAALLILAALMLGLVANAGPLGDLRHGRDRQVDYAALRAQLATGTAPVAAAPTDGGTALEPGSLVAVLHIPGIRLREVVREGTTPGLLARGPGHRRDTPLPGQAGVSVLLGRQAVFGGPFARLDDVLPGEELTVTTGQGKHRYRITGIRRAGDPQPPPPGDGEGRLTLVTAEGTPFMPTGILRVDAELVSEPQGAAAPAVRPGALPADEQAMGTQETAWMPLVLWCQALVLAAAALAWVRARWGRGQTWFVGVPLMAVLGLAAADQALLLMPNLV
ncbi:sortase [Streptomyces sp. NPDC051940]|uniref:sortase n=1 Tax=Streptomyces sp. NPDC051940 TaxID=3155675 RepID=UPI0034425B49